MQDIKLWFEKARVPVKIEKEPLNSVNLSVNNQDIFQMNISTRGKKHKREYFRIFHGHEGNDVRVVHADSNNQQVILLVNEPEREYTVRRWDREENKWVYEKQKAPGYLRKYLCGYDETHLFIAELPNDLGPINKVLDAHKILKPKLVAKKEKKIGKIKRQGEWFFIPLNSIEQASINKISSLYWKNERIGPRGGNPHMAEKLFEIDEEIFVSGKITHIEHKTLRLNGWFKAVKNMEFRGSSPASQIYNGVKWID